MKLNQRYTLSYVAITLLVLNIGFAIVYHSIEHSSTQLVARKLERLNGLVADALRTGQYDSRFHTGRNISISSIPLKDTASAEGIDQYREWSDDLLTEVPIIRYSTFCVVNGHASKITSKAMIVEPDSIYLNGITFVFAWTFVFLLALVMVLSEILSWHILKPFSKTLEAIQQFQINQQSTIDVQETKTDEFRELNSFLVKMTNRAKRDYLSLKEFSENASHELQTPIATMKAKIELLMETTLEEMQVNAISEIHNELERLARINSALTLLAKLEHYEVDGDIKMNFSRALEEQLTRFSDWMEMKHIALEQDIAPDVMVHLEDSLGQLLLTNLVSNAVRHNVLHGQLKVLLTHAVLSIQNTGKPPLISVDKLFGRFKKGNSALDSNGIGLAIVKKIVELYDHTIQYEYANGIHSIIIKFNTTGHP